MKWELLKSLVSILPNLMSEIYETELMCKYNKS